MGEIKVKLSDKTEQAFRESAMHEFGFRKGSFSLAAEQALGSWAKQHEDLEGLRKNAREKIKDPVESITGILKGFKIDSVKLQHETSKWRSERWKKHALH